MDYDDTKEHTRLNLILYDSSSEIPLVDSEKLKQIILRSLVTVFGVLEASRVKFEVYKNSKSTILKSNPLLIDYYTIETSQSYVNTIRTGITLSKENIRVRFVNI